MGQALTHLAVAIAQQAELTLDQGNGGTPLVGDAHFRQQLFAVGEEVRVIQQPVGDQVRVQFGGLAHTLTWPS